MLRKSVMTICALFICALFTVAPAMATPAQDNGIPADETLRATVNDASCGLVVRTGKFLVNLASAPLYTAPKAFVVGLHNPRKYSPQQHLPEGVPTLPRAIAAAGNQLGSTVYLKGPAILFAPEAKEKSLAKWDELTGSTKKGLDQPPVLQCIEAGAYITMPLTASMGVIPATLVRQSGHVAIVSGGTSLVGTYGRAAAD
jgi:hypothetical protein